MRHYSFALYFLFTLSLLSCRIKDNRYDATGSFEATEIIVSAKVPGSILAVSAQEGDRYSQGVSLALIDTTMWNIKKRQLQEAYQGMKSSLVNIDEQVAPLVQQLKLDERELRRSKALYSDSATTAQKLDISESSVQVLREKIALQRDHYERANVAVQSQLEGLNWQIKEIEEQLSYCQVAMPVDGTLVTQFVEPQEYVTPGKPLFMVANLKNIYLLAYFTSEQLLNVKLGDEVSVVADYGADKTREYTGTIRHIGVEAEYTPKGILTDSERANLVYPVKVAVRNDGFIRLGMYGGVNL